VAKDTSGLLTSSSNSFCIDALVTTPSEFLYLATASVLQDGGVELYGFVDPASDVRTVRVERAENIIGPYQVVANLPKPTVAPYQIVYSDFSAMTDGLSYYYRLVAIDSCDALDTTSNLGRTIFAEVTKNGNVTNTVRWTPYTEFAGGVERYALYRSVDDGVFTLVNDNLTRLDTIVLDNVRAFGGGEGSFCYRVVATEGPNPDGFLAPGGLPFQARSNDACVNHEARVFIPSAFNVNSDNPENRVWRPQNIFSQPGTYELKIFDRWGSEVFSTENTQEAWNGTINGNDAPMGVYVYFIKYNSKEDYMQEEKGSLTLIR
jgi:gliding motility-associated-like protein